jgi:formylglycine-generating enzyme required for sulfatase activity
MGLNPKDTFKDCPECPEMVVVPTGFFIMGSPVNEKSRDENEGPQRKVTISSPLAIAKYEVTFAEWDACVNAGGCKHKPDDEGWGRGARPVINISWDDITSQYLPWLSDKAGATYRLLTEAEWEYAARATSETKFPFGDDDKALCSHANVADLTAHQRYSNWTAANCRDGFVNTAPVGSFVANAFGLHDMVGNVWEWVQDCYIGSYRGQPTDGSAASSGDCSKRALRGGAWIGHPSGVRSASRYWLSPETRDNAFGFRVVRTLDR